MHKNLLLVVLLVLLWGTPAAAQADGLVAYVPERPVDRTADDERIGFMESAVAGKLEAIIPPGSERVDLLNARGNVKKTYVGDQMDDLSLGSLRPGTWTLRVHRQGGLLVRRFVVMERGAIRWSPKGPIKRR